MSLRVRLNLIITALIVLFTLVTGKIIVDDMRSSIREEIEAGTRVTVQLMETVIASSQASDVTAANRVLLAFLRHVGRVRANEIRFYDADGDLLYESPPPIYKQGRWAPQWFTRLVRPEIGEARMMSVWPV